MALVYSCPSFFSHCTACPPMSVEASTENEKASARPQSSRFSWLKSKQADNLDSIPPSPLSEERASPDLGKPPSVDEDLKPVAFTGLFRFVLPLFAPPIAIFIISS
jgi:hypothetical protein